MTQEFNTPRSPYEKIRGLVFLARTIDKIRLNAAGQLRPDFFALMRDGYDARIMKCLQLDYATFAELVRTGATDEECWHHCVQQAPKLSGVGALIWNDFAAKPAEKTRFPVCSRSSKPRAASQTAPTSHLLRILDSRRRPKAVTSGSPLPLNSPADLDAAAATPSPRQ